MRRSDEVVNSHRIKFIKSDSNLYTSSVAYATASPQGEALVNFFLPYVYVGIDPYGLNIYRTFDFFCISNYIKNNPLPNRIKDCPKIFC